MMVTFGLARDRHRDFWLVLSGLPVFMFRHPKNDASAEYTPGKWGSYVWKEEFCPLIPVSRLEFLLDTGRDLNASVRRDLDAELRCEQERLEMTLDKLRNELYVLRGIQKI